MNIGAIYRRCDFQVHTPRDDNFSGSECITDAERMEYATKFIAACRQKKLDAVAITDHHDLIFYEYINKASQEEKDSDGHLIDEKKRIIIFPGMELTLDVPCQAILIFDSTLDITDELRARIYAALGINSYKAKNESRATSPVIRLSFKSINDIYISLNKLTDIENRFTVFPNVKEDGSVSIIRKGLYNEYANGIFVGGYLDKGQYEKLRTKEGWNNVIAGKTKAYGYKSIGLFQTSDCRNENFDDLGICSTWVKWSEPTAEGIRQACLAKESRISQEEPELPTTRIVSLTITNSIFLKDIHIDFNPQFNVLIGGRGTGKSSILQYISWVLGKDADERRKQELESFIKSTLDSKSKVLLVIDKNGVQYQIERTLADYKLKIGNNEWSNTQNKNIVDVLQADSFSQKELSKHEKNRTDQLNQLIEYSINDELNSIKRQISENGDLIKESNTIYESLINSKDSLEALNNQIESINEQINKLSDALSAVPDEDKKIIEEHNLLQNEKQILRRAIVQIKDSKNAVTTLLSSIDLTPLEVSLDETLNKTELSSFVAAHSELLESMNSKLNEVLNLTSPELTSITKSITDSHTQHNIKYEEAKLRQIEFEGIIKTIEELREQLKVLVDDKDRIQSAIEKNKNVIKKIWNSYYLRDKANAANWELINKAKNSIIEKSDGTIQIELTSCSNIDAILKKFIEAVTGSKGQPERVALFFTDLKNGSNTYKNLLKFWISLFRAKQENKPLIDLFSEYGLKNNHLIEGDLKRILDSLDTSNIVDFSLMLPSYELILNYKKDASVTIPFDQASYGQQAGAILSILLNQITGPLIIDQPEDDLDNKVIHQITESIVRAKKKRQIIFSSHNANIAVNGDAELILCFDHNSDSSAGEIATKGAIDNIQIKATVKDIMEGGEKAFNLRQNKYGF